MQILSAVNCSGARHKIGLSSKGKLVFFGHPDGLKEGCRCYEILEKWREHKTDKVPVKIREITRKVNSYSITIRKALRTRKRLFPLGELRALAITSCCSEKK